MLEWFQQGGLIMWILLAVSVLSWCVIFERFYVILIESRNASRLGKKLDRTGFDRNAVLEALGDSSSALAAVLRGVGENARLKKEDNLFLTRSMIREQTGRLERGLTFLEIAASASPLLGLLGTVLGMVEVFGVIAKIGVGDPTLLSSGISRALNTTVFGLIVAIPALAAYSVYGRKIENLVRSIEKYATRALSEIYRSNR
jgi:biopolymer transport protein ExbB